MKKRPIFQIVVLALFFISTGCNNKSGKLNIPSTFAPPTGPAQLKLKWVTGERVIQEMNIGQAITAPALGPYGKENILTRQKMLLTVLNEDAEGGHELQLTFLRIVIAADISGKGRMNYDSDNSSITEPQNIVARVGQIVAASKILYFLNADNRIKRIDGVGDLGERLSAAGPSASQFKRLYNENYFEFMFGCDRFLSPKPIQPGDTWMEQAKYYSDLLGTPTMKCTCTFKDWETFGKRTCARIEFYETMKSTSGSRPLSTGVTMAIQDGNGKGVMWFDPELGIAIDTKCDEEFTETLTVPNQVWPDSKDIATNRLSIEVKVDSVE